MARRNRFVTPEAVRYDLKDSDDWIEIKKRLAYGDRLRLESVGMTGINADALVALGTGAPVESLNATIDWQRWQIEKLAIWLADWNLAGADGRPVKLNRETIKALDEATANEINALIDSHAETMREEQASDPTTSGQNGTSG